MNNTEMNRQQDIAGQPAKTDYSEKKRRQINRAKQRKKLDKVISARMVMLFFAFALLIALFLLVIPRSKVSEVERRSLSTWPHFSVAGYFAGEYTDGIKQYYDDTVPARDGFKNLGNNIKNLFGLTTTDSVEIIGNITKIENEAEEVPADTETEGLPVEEETAAVIEEATEEETTEEAHTKNYHMENADGVNLDGILVVNQDGHWRAISLYGAMDMTLYADTVNHVYESVGEDVNVYVLPIPLAVQFYCPANYMEYSLDLRDVYKELVGLLDEGIPCIDSIDLLESHNEEPIYLRTDHHWAPLGAYYTAGEFAKAAGVFYEDLENYERNVREGYVGTMYAFTESANILNDPEDFVYYIPPNSYVCDYYYENFEHFLTKGLFFPYVAMSDTYGIFLGEDDLIIKITTDVDNGRVLLVVKDSFGNAIVPFLTSSFEKIYVIDQRYFEVNLLNFIYSQGITDVLFAHSYFSLGGAEAELLDYITYSNTDVAIYDDAPEAVVPLSGNYDLGNAVEPD